MRPLAQHRASVRFTAPRPGGRLWLRAMLGAILLPWAFGSSAQAGPRQHHAPKTVRHTIAALEQRWTSAELSGNANALGSMLAEDYLGIAPDGRLDSKADTLRSVRDGLIRFASIKTTTHKIRVYGSTAVVVSTAEVSGTYNGHPINGRYRYTRVYHLDGAGWKIVSFEANRVRERGENKTDGAPDAAPASPAVHGASS